MRSTATPIMVKVTIELLCSFAEERKMKASVKFPLKCAFSILGILVGVLGIAAALLCAWMKSGQFKPVSQILKELLPEEQQKLRNKAETIIRNLNSQGMWNEDLEKKLLAMLETYITKELHADIRYDD